MGFFEVPAPALRRARLAQELPVEPVAAVEDLAAVVADLPDPMDLSAEQRLGALQAAARVQVMVEAYLTRVAGVADALKDARLFAGGTTGTMVAAVTGANPAVGSALVARARELRLLPAVEQAYGEGRISGRHVRLLCQASAQVPQYPDVEEQLLTVASLVEPAALASIVAVLIAQSRPEAPDEQMERARRQRGLRVTELDNGMIRVEGHLDPVAGRRVREALEAFTDPPAPDDPRSAAQRRADALEDLAAVALTGKRRFGTSGVSVLVDVDGLPARVGARLEDGTPLGPDTFDMLSCAAVVSVIFGRRRQGQFVPLALARTARRASAAQWAALIARDGGCVRCGRPPRHCQAHHVVHWIDGGLTDIEDMCLFCARCHRDLHNGRFGVEMVDGLPVCTPLVSRRRRR